VLARSLVDNGYTELKVSSAHAEAVADLPENHRDPFDRLLLAQASVEGIVLVTSDGEIAKYGSDGWPVRLAN
jgi:PIN domain nuclease of toxin-antitoxin system